MTGVRSRIGALEKLEKPEVSFADRLEAARRRRLQITPEEQEASRVAAIRDALSTAEPDHPLLAALWRARRRLARHYGITS